MSHQSNNRHTVADSVACRQCGGKVSEIPGREYFQCDYCLSMTYPAANPLDVDSICDNGQQLNSNCPQCHQHLSGGTLDEFPILYCEHCYGILMKNGHFGNVVSNRRASRNGQGGRMCEPLDTRQYNRQLHCPACHNHMEVHPYYGPSNTVIDSCADCGLVWLDHGELRRIVRAAGTNAVQPSLLSSDWGHT